MPSDCDRTGYGSCVALANGDFVCSSPPVQPDVDAIPPGSFRDKCSRCRYDAGLLTCRCGVFQRRSSVDVRKCDSDIDVDGRGRLACRNRLSPR